MKRIFLALVARTSGFFAGIRTACTLFKIGAKGENNSINGKITVINPRNLKVGSNNSFNHGDYINAFSPITIGSDVTISANCNIVSTGIDYPHWFSTGKKRHTESGEIVIGDHVWIGTGCTILPGVHITGEYVVIAAGSVVTKDIIDSHCVVAGVPAKIIKRLEK